MACKHCAKSWVYVDSGKEHCQTCGKEFQSAWPPLPTKAAAAASSTAAPTTSLVLCLEQAGILATEIDEDILKVLTELQAKKAAAAPARKPQVVLHESTARVGAAHATEQRARLAFDKIQKNIERLCKELAEYQDKLAPACQVLEEAEEALETAKAEQAGLLCPAAAAVKHESEPEPTLEQLREQMLQLQATIAAADLREREAKEAAAKEAAAKIAAHEKAAAEGTAPLAASPSDERPAPIKVDGDGLRLSGEMETDEIEDPDGEGYTAVGKQVKRLNDTAKQAIEAATEAAKTAKRTSATTPRGKQRTG